MPATEIGLDALEALAAEIDADIAAILADRDAPLPPAGTPQRDAVAAAALVGPFDATALAADPSPAAQALVRLSEQAGPAGPADGLWSLRPAERRQVLTHLVRENAVADAVARIPDSLRANVNHVLVDQLQGKPVPVTDLSPAELTRAAQAADVLHGVADVPGAPVAATEIEARLTREHLLTTLRALAAGRFAGRVDELRTLREFVGRSAAAGGLEANARDPNALLLYGPGGMGKSTLLAEFLLRDVIRDGAPAHPFAYLDFDRRSLSIVNPVTILDEALAQISAFYPQRRAVFQAIRDDWRPAMRGAGGPVMASGLESMEFSNARQTGRFSFDFCSALANVPAAGGAFLLILDTFEEVQSRSAAYVAELFDFLSDLQYQMAMLLNGAWRLCVILSGRVPVPEAPAVAVPLKELKAPDAERFLQSLGVDPKLTPRVVGQVGGVPLTLRLAAALMLKAQDDVLSRGEFDSLHPVWYQLGAEQLQGQIVERYLKQIHDPAVRKLARPGLVLRVVTEPMIPAVLAGPCGLEVAEPGETETPDGEDAPADPDAPRTAADLFQALAREVSLVSQERAGVLRHRPDLRAVMLGPLLSDAHMKRKVAQIHRNAVAFHAAADDAASRAEEIYHRLHLGQSEKTITARWLPGVESCLRDCLDELPAQARPVLAARLGRDGDVAATEAERRQWDQATWERHADSRAGRLLKLNQPAEALAVLRERADRAPGSALFPLEVSALKHLGDWDGMREAAAKGVASCADAGNPKLAYELGRTLVMAILLSNRLDEADRLIAQARGLARLNDKTRNAAFELELDLAEIRVAEMQAAARGGGPPAERDEVFDRVSDRFADLLKRSRGRAYADLARQVAGALGARRPDMVRAVLRRFGVADGELNKPRLRLLGRAFITWDEIASAGRRQPDGVLAAAVESNSAGEALDAVWRRALQERGPAVNDLLLETLMERFGLPDAALRRFVEFLRLPPEAELFAPLHTTLVNAMTADELTAFVRDELGQDLAAITKGSDRRDVARQLLSWAYDEGRFQELIDRVAVWTRPPAVVLAAAAPALTPVDLRKLHALIRETFVSTDALAAAVNAGFDNMFDQISAVSGPLADVAYDTIQWFDHRGKSRDLVRILTAAKPENAPLAQFAAKFGIQASVSGAAPRPAVLDGPATFMDRESWHARRAAFEVTVCRIETAGPESALVAIGLLVAPDLVLTRRRGLGDLTALAVRFVTAVDAAGRATASGTRRFRADPVAAAGSADDLDYVFLRVDGDPGRDTVATAAGPATRGWLWLDPERRPQPRDATYLLDYSPDGWLQFRFRSESVVTVARDTTAAFLQDDSSNVPGSPLVTQDWAVIALHEKSATPGSGLAAGLLIAAVLADLKRQNLAKLVAQGFDG